METLCATAAPAPSLPYVPQHTHSHIPPHSHTHILTPTLTHTHAQVLVDLVLLNFNPALESATLVCQALPVFFQSYAEMSCDHQQFLATAFLPAARL